ncbi:MAG: tRNA (adenosine(37)-N6)-threonylcarbamoyltransferase complex dimerization subunit type 1 TsaB [Clostridia bacterium]|nr:tRNA (adenosine(37)-N6)-threonylcarbamoyltransferase complex dimerization subunit type 1 TsaB [Clostridia bacterium]
MRILSMETSSFPASVSIFEDGKIIAENYINTKFTHSQTLMPMVSSVFDFTKINLSDIDLIAVSEGPGSFTGVRIGIATAKGLAVPGKIKCMGISSLEALAFNLYDNNGEKLIYSCIDARVGQCYNAVFRLINGTMERICDDRVISDADLKTEIESLDTTDNLWIVGDYAEKVATLTDRNVRVAGFNLMYQKASSVALAAYKSYKPEENYSAAEVQPKYLQLPQATRELNKRKKENI